MYNYTQPNTTRWEQKSFRLTHATYLRMDRPKTGLYNKVRPKVRSIKYSKLHTKANSEFHLGMKHLKLDAPYLWPYFVAKSSVGRSIRRYAPWVWRKDFGLNFVVFRCAWRVREFSVAWFGYQRQCTCRNGLHYQMHFTSAQAYRTWTYFTPALGRKVLDMYVKQVFVQFRPLTTKWRVGAHMATLANFFAPSF